MKEQRMNRPMTDAEKAAEARRARSVAAGNIGRERVKRTALPPEYDPDVGLPTVDQERDAVKRAHTDARRGRNVLPPGDRE